jgi:peptide deformylase
MAVLDILHFPDLRLRKRAERVARVDDALRHLIDDMFETMYAAPGIGLAATQIGMAQQVLVADVSEDKTQPLTVINPEIIATEGAERMQEGCLSVPGFFDEVERAERIRIRGVDATGEPLELDADGLLAVCLQHEVDHLNGKLFVDYLS